MKLWYTVHLHKELVMSEITIVDSLNGDKRSVGKFNNIFHKTIRKICIEYEITSNKFTEMFYEAIKHKNLLPLNLSAYRNDLFNMINGKRNLSYNKFKFIIEDVFNLTIPDDPELIHFKNLGQGKELRGCKFGRLSVIECVGVINNNGQIYWKCLCSNIIDGVEKCGNESIIIGSDLTSGHTKSCGCYGEDQARISMIKRMTTHGKRYTKSHKSWDSMIQRCYNTNNDNYNNYGGRGIYVDERWHLFENFYKDMGDRPEGMTLDRIDVNGHYCKINCRWATQEQQNYNMKHTIRFNDGTPVGLWAKQNKFEYNKVRWFYRKGYSKMNIFENISTMNS